MTTATLTNQEVLFLNRMAVKMAAGLSMDDAGRAVLADDEAAYAKVHKLNRDELYAFTRRMAQSVFGAIHTREARA